MKKINLMLLAITLSLVLFGCGDETDSIDDPDNIEQVTIEYAVYDNQDIEIALVEKFEELHPNIKVIVRSDLVETYGSTGFSEGLVQQAAIGDLPDVFQVMKFDPLVENLLVYDISDLWNADLETNNVLLEAQDAFVFGDKRLGMANGQAIQGMYVNKNLLDDLNFDLEDYGFDFSSGEIWNYDEMIQLATDFKQRAVSSKNNPYYWGIDGDWGVLNFPQSLSAMDHPDWGIDSFDGENFHFTDDTYINLYQKEIDLYLSGVKNDIKKSPEAAQLEFGNSNPSNVEMFFDYGRTLLFSSYTWNFLEVSESVHDIMFLPFPKGIEEDSVVRVPSSVGGLAISKNTQHPEEAYELAKYMSWSKQGFLDRIEVNETLGTVLTKFPVSNYDDVWMKIRELYSDSSSETYIEGFDMIISALTTGEETLMWGKWIPGWSSFADWRTYRETESFKKAVENGEKQFADVAQIWQDKVTEFVSSKLQSYKNYPNLNTEETNE